MAGMPRLLAVARRPLSASLLYRVVYSVADTLPAPATSPPARDFVPRCSLPRSHGWETRAAVRAFCCSSGEGGGSGGSSRPGETQAAESQAVKGQGRLKSRAKTSSPTSPPAISSEEERRSTYLPPEDPGLRNLGGLSTSAPSGIAKDTVAAVDTVAASALDKVVSVPSLNTDASDGGVNAGAASGKVSAPSDSVNTGLASCVGKEDSVAAVNTGAMNCIGKDPDGGVHKGNAVDTDASNGGVVADAAGIVCKPEATRAGTDAAIVVCKGAAGIVCKPAATRAGTDAAIVVCKGAAGIVCKPAATRAGTDAAIVVCKGAAAGMANEAGHGVEGTDASSWKHGVRRTRVRAAAAALSEKTAAADVEKNAAPGKDRLADAKNDAAPEGGNGDRVISKEKKAVAGKGSSARVTGVEKKVTPGKRAGARQKLALGSGSNDGTATGSGSHAEAGSQPGHMDGEKKKKTLITLAEYLPAMENRIERGLFETRAHLERKLSWVLSSFESMLQNNARKWMEEQQLASRKLQLKHTFLLFVGLLAQLFGILAVCIYLGYKYAWVYVEQKIFTLPYDDRAKAVALEAFQGGMKYVLGKITFQDARDELRKKLPDWLGGGMEEKKVEEKKEEKLTPSRWWWPWLGNWWMNKEKKKKEEERKRKEEEERKKRKEEEEEKKKKHSSWWWLWPGNWWRSKEEEMKEVAENKEEEKKEHRRWWCDWCLWPDSWCWLWLDNWWKKKEEGQKKEEDEEKEKKEDGNKKGNHESLAWWWRFFKLPWN